MKAFSLLFFSFLFFSNLGFTQVTTPAEIAYDIVTTAEKFHYSPPSIDDEYADRVYDLFLKDLDPLSIYFLQDDFNHFHTEKHSIDNYILAKNEKFLVEVTERFQKRVSETTSFLKTINPDDLDFKEVSSLTVSNQLPPNSINSKQEKWIKILKSQLLIDFHEKAVVNATNLDAFEKYVQQQLSITLNQMICQIEEKYLSNNSINDFVNSKYFHAISTSFDPHTVYFNLEENKSFNNDLSKEALSFGMDIYKNQEGTFELVQLVPGGPAWSSNQLNEGDVLQKLENEKNEEIELACLSQSVFQQTLNELDSATFTFKKSDGKKVILKITKQAIEVSDNIIDSYVLKGEQKIGYLYLPSFYTEESNGYQLPNGCANDIAKQLLKLKREGIEGLIIDLRNNGGGSMLEAIRLAGIFINFGAVAITDEREKEPITLKDMDRGMIFSNPLAVLVNNHSASASELFAATMQDHKRGVILGENTFGKSTFQQVIPVDAYRNPTLLDRESPKGYLKVTLGKFFRVTGESHQGKGVKVDIPLQENNNHAFHEEDLPYALLNTKITKKTYYTPFAELPINQLKTLKAARSKESKPISQEEDEINSIPLNFNQFKKLYTTTNQEDNDTTVEANSFFKANLPSFFFEQNELTPIEQRLQNQTITSIERDSYILESYLILSDLIKLMK